MKLKTYLLIGFLTVFTTAFSQSRLVYVNDLGDDWRIGLAAGIQKFSGTPSGSVSFTETLSPALELHLSKWLTPAYGLRIGYKGASFSLFFIYYLFFVSIRKYFRNNYISKYGIIKHYA